jgi:hypothetical protein
MSEKWFNLHPILNDENAIEDKRKDGKTRSQETLSMWIPMSSIGGIQFHKYYEKKICYSISIVSNEHKLLGTVIYDNFEYALAMWNRIEAALGIRGNRTGKRKYIYENFEEELNGSKN